MRFLMRPELEGLDVPLLALTADGRTRRHGPDATRPMVTDIFLIVSSHVTAIAPYPPQVVFCNHEINSLACGLQALKCRAHLAA
jgi:hypothetical protein